MEKAKKKQNKEQQKKQLNLCKYSLDLEEELGLNIPKEEVHIIPVFIPHRGCKNECVFCNQRRISGELRQVGENDVDNIIKEYLEYYENKDYSKIQVAFFGGSFTGLDIKEQEMFLNVANKYIQNKEIGSIRVSTRPDYINQEILDLLKEKHVEVIELGVQSMVEDVLLKAKRGHSKQDVINASKLIKENGIKLGHQLMVGLPESTKSKELESIKECINLNPDMMRIYPVYTLKESELYSMYERKEYIPLEIVESVDRTTEIYKECVKAKLNVIRIGLQTTEEINTDNKEIVGPVLDNYREKVLSKIARDYIEENIKLKENTIIELTVPHEQINYIVGANKENIQYFKDKYNCTVKVIKE